MTTPTPQQAESAAAVFERVLGEHEICHGASLVTVEDLSYAYCSCGDWKLSARIIALYQAHRAHVAAQLATALAQPDTLGDGGGVVCASGRPGCILKTRAIEDPDLRLPWLDDQPSATSERGGRDE